MYSNSLKVISGFGLISSLLFLIFSFINRILLPFGDEPDFTVRAPRLLYGDHPIWTPYYMFHDILVKLNPFSMCNIKASPTSLFAFIGANCTENLEQILIRFFIVFIVTLPLLYAVTFRKSFVVIMNFFRLKLTTFEWNTRLDTLSIALIFPSILYYLGIFAEEQLTLVLSLFVFLFWDSFFLISLIVFLIMSIDFGNSIVVITFILFGYFFSLVAKKISLKISMVLMLGIILFAFIIGFTFLTYLENVSFLAQKAQAMYSKGLNFENKYPVILRPIVTFMTAVFMTPSGVKIILLYLIYAPVLVFTIHKLNIVRKKINTKEFNRKYILFFSVFTTILFFVFLFPDYSFAKYYVFMLPFIIFVIISLFDKLKVWRFIIATNLIIYFHLILYRI